MDFVREYEPDSTGSLIKEIGLFRKIYIYMPTWRDSQREIFIQGMDMQKLNGVLCEKGDLLLLKPHANTIIKDFSKDFSNIRLIDAKTDVYPILPFTDILITDYSSILYDYILMPGKKVILYLYDYSEYVKDRDFYYPFDDNVIGAKASDFGTLLTYFKEGVPDIDPSERNMLLQRFWGDTMGIDSCSEITNRFIFERTL